MRQLIPVSDNDVPFKKDNEQINQNCNEPEPEREMSKSLTQLSEASVESEDFYMIRSEMKKLQEQLQKEALVSKRNQCRIDRVEEINAEPQAECLSLRKKAQELLENNMKLQSQLQEKEEEKLASKESEMAAVNAGSNDAAQTILDIEHDINSHLVEHGVLPSRSGTFTHHNEEMGLLPRQVRFSASQLLEMETAFEKNNYVVGAEKKNLAKDIGLQETQVPDYLFVPISS